MAKRTTQTNRTLIDPAFPIPKGAEDEFVYTETPGDEFYDPEDDSLFYDELVDAGSDLVEYYEEDFGEAEDVLDIPDEFTIISQTVRRAPGGYQVIDVVIQTEDIDGAINYEVRVTKL